ncbi:unnamed protein product [Arctogadus glacialis]
MFSSSIIISERLPSELQLFLREPVLMGVVEGSSSPAKSYKSNSDASPGLLLTSATAGTSRPHTGIHKLRLVTAAVNAKAS